MSLQGPTSDAVLRLQYCKCDVPVLHAERILLLLSAIFEIVDATFIEYQFQNGQSNWLANWT